MKRKNIDLARGLRHRMTDAERALWRHLRGRRFQDWKFRRQHPVAGFVVDFVCLDVRLVVELDGGQHVDRSLHDEERTHALERVGYRVARFWNDDILVRTDAVLEAIMVALKQTPSPQPSPHRGEGDQRASRCDLA